MSLITCDNVSFRYENHLVLKELNLNINRGDYLCVIGENGSGKSTLLKGLLGLKKPSNGCIRMGDGLKQNEIGYLPQQMPAQKDFPASVNEVVLSGCLNRLGLKPFYPKSDKEKALNYMKALGIDSLQNKCYRELSGGQQQRVLLARALCATKSVLLLDEPVSGLDPVATAEFYEVIRKIRTEQGIAIIMVSHDINSIVQEADHILYLQKDDYFYGTIDEYKESTAAMRFKGVQAW